MTLLLIVLVLALAAAGGFLGDLLQVAGWIIVVLVALGAVVGLAAYLWIRRLLERLRS